MKNSLKVVTIFVFVLSSLLVALPSGAQINPHVATQCDNWPATCDVTFNSGIPGSNATPVLQSSSVGPVNLTPFNNPSPMFTYPGYTFLGWIALSTSVLYSDRAPYSFITNIALTAQWVLIPTTTIGLSGGNGTSQVFYMSGPQGTSITLPSGSGLSNPGYTFTGWNTSVNMPTGQLLAGSSYLLVTSTSLYAQWLSNPILTVTFPSSVGSGSISPLSGPQGTSITLPSGSGLSNPGYTFTGWNTSVNMPTGQLLAGSSYLLTNSTSMYPQWLINSTVLINFYGPGTVILPNTDTAGGLPTSPTSGAPLLSSQFALVLNANGGNGSIPKVVGTIGNAIAVPSSVGMSKLGYVFISWNTSIDGSGVKFIPTESVFSSNVIVLYAQWSALLKSSSSTLLGSISSFAVNSAALTPQLKSQIHNLAALLAVNKQKNVTIYGYTTYSTATAANLSISQARANAVAQYLRSQLTAMHVLGVLITAKGEGSVKGQIAAAYRRVEIFV